jgi:hypothetical protein
MLLTCCGCVACCGVPLQAAEGGPVHDPELGRVVQPWSGGQAEMLARAWLRYGPDRLDKVAEVSRGRAAAAAATQLHQS